MPFLFLWMFWVFFKKKFQVQSNRNINNKKKFFLTLSRQEKEVIKELTIILASATSVDRKGTLAERLRR